MKLRSLFLVPAIALSAALEGPGRPVAAAPTFDLAEGVAAVGACGAALPPESVRMRPTQQSPGSRGTMILTQPASPFGVAVDADGFQTYDVTVEIGQMRRRDGLSYVVWAATPELDQSVRLGTLDDTDSVTGRVAWNKFLVFVSEEASADVETWAGPILLTGLSPSGRMHTMAGHGPFEDANCSDFIY
ncbi:MAG: hypothetical protein R3195_13110 [Gemmatimonadota bacterium]|nr:hypothetical protein [Gemmatimonadota bacterium]